jgi:hypothetical protein
LQRLDLGQSHAAAQKPKSNAKHDAIDLIVQQAVSE